MREYLFHTDKGRDCTFGWSARVDTWSCGVRDTELVRHAHAICAFKLKITIDSVDPVGNDQVRKSKERLQRGSLTKNSKYSFGQISSHSTLSNSMSKLDWFHLLPVILQVDRVFWS